MRYPAYMAASTQELLGEERRRLILDWLAGEGKVRASELGERLGVSLDTVRRDLQELAAQGALRRVHGGALPPSPGARRFVDRRGQDAPAKAAIAAAAVELLASGQVVALSGGTTVLELARRVPDDLEATVIATGPDIAVALADHPGLTVDVVGGRLHTAARVVTGADAVDALRRVRADVCLLSACSLHPAAGLTTRDREEALVVAALLGGAARVVILATAAKLGSAAPYEVAGLERIDVLVTDAPEDECVVYRELGVEVVRVPDR